MVKRYHLDRHALTRLFDRYPSVNVKSAVEDQQLRARHDCATEEEAQDLTHGETDIQTGDRCIQTSRQRIDGFVQFYESECLLKIFIVDSRPAESDMRRKVEAGENGAIPGCEWRQV